MNKEIYLTKGSWDFLIEDGEKRFIITIDLIKPTKIKDLPLPDNDLLYIMQTR